MSYSWTFVPFLPSSIYVTRRLHLMLQLMMQVINLDKTVSEAGIHPPIHIVKYYSKREKPSSPRARSPSNSSPKSSPKLPSVQVSTQTNCDSSLKRCFHRNLQRTTQHLGCFNLPGESPLIHNLRIGSFVNIFLLSAFRVIGLLITINIITLLILVLIRVFNI